ncbi:hypothetical protein HOY82DRAFT_139670 [Tuber indicum]|nr:hypothetical protein HOY82DRAFT_139670 [Tuber indicum]
MNDLFYHYHIIPFRSFSSRPSRPSVRPFSWSQDWCGWSRRMEGNQAMRNKAGRRRRGRQPKSVFTYLFYFDFFFLPSLYYHYDDYDMMRFLAFYFYSFTPWEEQGGSCFVLFCLVGMGKKKDLVWFWVSLCCDWTGNDGGRRGVFIV